jgi:phosphate-selective porin OprO/OprP
VEADFADKTFAPTVTTAAGGGAVALGSPGVKMKDVYIGVTELPVVGNVRIGHFKEPFGLEQLTGDNFYTFMEASTADDGAFVPVRDTGVMLWNWTENQRATWAFGVFKGAGVESTDGNSTNANFEAPLSIKSDDGLSLTERFTWLPWYDECTEGRGLLHTGISYSYRDPGNGSGTGEIVQFTQTSEAHLGPSIINMVFNGSPSATAANNAANALQHEDLVGGELAWVYGPFSVQSEYMGGYFNYFAGKGHNLAGTGGKGYGGYIFASYFLTGENRAYDRHHGVFTRVKPFENFFRVRGEDGCVYTGMGAWEIGYRLSYINLDNANGIDQTATAGLAATRAVDHTVGLNWYLNPYTKMMLNYVHTDDSVGAAYAVAAASSRGSIDTIEMRAQSDF